MTQTDLRSTQWLVKGRILDFEEKTFVMGVLNVTPDSFSDGGRYQSIEEAADAGAALLDHGADILDIGGESTRPGRPELVDEAEECRRVLPVLENLRQRFPSALLSVDTYKGEVARKCLEAGADIINDIYALQKSPEIAGHVARHGAGLILMHMQGDPDNMQVSPSYGNLLAEVRDFLRDRMTAAIASGVNPGSIVVDPGIGFGKLDEHNLQLLAGLEYLRLLQRPICIGASRKRFLGRLLGDLPVECREEATIAAHAAAVLQGASIVRVHNVEGARRSLAVIDAIRTFL